MLADAILPCLLAAAAALVQGGRDRRADHPRAPSVRRQWRAAALRLGRCTAAAPTWFGLIGGGASGAGRSFPSYPEVRSSLTQRAAGGVRYARKLSRPAFGARESRCLVPIFVGG
ncbi:hypothetical protein B0H14DRAFT_2827421 [Mycena olivaceomarginata]|nr:hypothetical protein B0H14DRAFT_2827421 [Mycena olivaceomarginata]